MTQREKFLAMVVGGLLVFGVIYWGFNKYQTALKTRTNQITSLEEEKMRLEETLFSGAIAERQMDEYFVRSLPGNTERARSQYSQWLLDMAQENRLRGANVDPSSPIPVGDLYNKHGFRVTGKADMSSVLNLMYSFYAKDYLHRIRVFDLKPDRSGGFDVELTVDAIGLNQVPADAEAPGTESWRVEPDVVAYREPIMNRNFFEPPNQAPKYTGKTTVEAYVNKTTPVPLTFKDPENHKIRYELIDAPEDLVSLDERSGTLRVNSDEKRKIEVSVRATDEGYPRRSIEQKLLVSIVDPPPPPAPPLPKPKFDDASRTFLAGLVNGGNEWEAWMDVRTRGKTLKLRLNDEFEIGTVKGKVTNITAKYVELEIEGQKLELKYKDALADAVKRLQED